jgi:hypothetical protein
MRVFGTVFSMQKYCSYALFISAKQATHALVAVPALQTLHRERPGRSAYCPGGHFWHEKMLGEAVSLLKVPGGQYWHSDKLSKSVLLL